MIDDTGLAAIKLLVAESDPKEKGIVRQKVSRAKGTSCEKSHEWR